MPVISFSANSATVYEPNTREQRRPDLKPRLNGAILQERFSGKFSVRSRSKLKRLISAWDYVLKEEAKNLPKSEISTQKKFGFITLTLPAVQKHSPKEIKRGPFNTFIVNLLREYPNTNYLWKAELQKNGHLHFHLLIDKFIDWKVIRKIWNSALKPLGYISEYQAKMKKEAAKGFEYYFQRFGKGNRQAAFKAWQYGIATDWSDPNSTDIHSLKKKKSAVAYVCKYVSKGIHKDEAEANAEEYTPYSFGRIWGCSDSLRSLPDLKVYVDSQEFENVEEVLKACSRSIFRDEFFAVYSIRFECFDVIRDSILSEFG